jgi:prepilin-type N-terminal cleavage/methylation domain-containing protein
VLSPDVQPPAGKGTMMQKRQNQRGFTLMELMVVIVIVAILAAVAVPLYINYVKDAQRTEAKGAIAAIVTAEQVHYQKYGGYIDYPDASFDLTTSSTLTPDKRLDVDLSDARAGGKWSFDVKTTTNGFTVKAINANNKLGVVYTHDRSATADPTKTWKEGDNTITP